ncbi:MAG: SH3 domain-containing protein [Clostridiales bacterium]|nr:SH3 domain-containing protein [Clostridiales bacterium]
MILPSVIAALTFFFMPSQTMLYDSAMQEVVNLPAGYFVLQSDSEAPDGYIKVTYADLDGYVKADDVQAVDYTPVTKYELTATFTCDNDGQPVRLRAAPKKSAEVLDLLGSSAKGRLYGSVTGEALIKDAGTDWYYVSIEGKRGYVYYAHVKADDIPPNIIEKEPTTPADAPATKEPKKSDDEIGMPTTAAIIFIVALCIPVPFIMFYLFKKPKND